MQEIIFHFLFFFSSHWDYTFLGNVLQCLFFWGKFCNACSTSFLEYPEKRKDTTIAFLLLTHESKSAFLVTLLKMEKQISHVLIISLGKSWFVLRGFQRRFDIWESQISILNIAFAVSWEIKKKHFMSPFSLSRCRIQTFQNKFLMHFPQDTNLPIIQKVWFSKSISDQICEGRSWWVPGPSNLCIRCTCMWAIPKRRHVNLLRICLWVHNSFVS